MIILDEVDKISRDMQSLNRQLDEENERMLEAATKILNIRQEIKKLSDYKVELLFGKVDE